MGGALSFNGTSSRVTVPDSASLHLSSAMTLEAWVNPATTTAAWRDVIYKGNDNYYLEGTSDTAGRPGAGGTFGTTYGTSALAVNTWSYLAVSYDRTTIRLYVNGTQVSTLAATGAIASSTNPLSIGSDSLYGQYFQGLIDDVRVYNTALTQAQIQTDMTTPVAPPAPDTSPPSAPGTLSANAVSGSRVDLSWGTASDNVGVTGYRVERCQGAGCSNFAQIATTAGTTTSYSDTTASAGTSYSYRVRANDAAANLGPYSNTATATTPSPDTSPPSAPGTLSANAVSGSRVDLSWGTASDNVGVTGYRVERCQGAGCSNFAQIATTAGTTTSYSDTTASAGTSYSYRVRANDAAANLGPYSNTATTTTANTTYSIGGTVTGLSGTVVLQNNGGDDLSVSSSGPFTFNTPLAGGATYNVTVKTSPSGQTCTVSGGSGTVASANVTNIAVACTDNSATGGSDDFNRADGGLGANWAAISDGGLSISSQTVVGSSAGLAGDIRTGETYAGDQYSQVELTSTQLTGGQWIGPAVRAQNGGQDTYLGIYFWNNGSPQLRLYTRSAGTWIQLGSSYNCGPLAAGTQLRLVAVGSRISFQQDGVERIAVSDSSLTGGAPGIMAYGAARGDNWSGATATSSGTPNFQIFYQGSDANGVASYDVISADNGGTQVLRVLPPTNPAPGVPHNFLYVLPVEAGLGAVYGDGLETLRSYDAQNQYNLTIIEPSFGIEPWYADNPNDSTIQYETFLTKDLLPWVTQNLSLSSHEQNWLIGFSKSGIGGQDLLLKHPDLFALAASWDFPADMTTYDQFGSSSANSYGTDANFQQNYRLTPGFVDSHKAPFLSNNRIWIGGYSAFQTDISDYDTLLTSEGIAHSTEAPQVMTHRWDSGWVPIALTALRQDSINLLAP